MKLQPTISFAITLLPKSLCSHQKIMCINFLLKESAKNSSLTHLHKPVRLSFFCLPQKIKSTGSNVVLDSTDFHFIGKNKMFSITIWYNNFFENIFLRVLKWKVVKVNDDRTVIFL